MVAGLARALSIAVFFHKTKSPARRAQFLEAHFRCFRKDTLTFSVHFLQKRSMGESNRDQMDGEIGSVVGAGAVIWSDLTTDAGDKGGPRIQLARRNLRVVWSVGW